MGDWVAFKNFLFNDLLQPLKALNANLWVLNKQYGDNTVAQEARRHLEEINQMFTDLRNYERAGRGFEFTWVDCSELFSQVEESLKRHLEERKVVLRCGPLPAI